MKFTNNSFLFIGLLMYLFGVLIIGLSPLVFEGITFVGLIITLVLTSISFNFIKIWKKLRNKKANFFLSWFMNYVCLILAVCLFEVVIKKALNFYELFDMQKYEKLHRIYINDLARNFLFIFGLFYSLFAALLNLLVTKIIDKRRKILRT